MISFEALIHSRQSVRKYQNKPVEREKIEKLIEAVHLAPSACNSQPWKLIVVDNPELKNEVAQATFSKTISFNKFAQEAPVIAVLIIEKAKLIAQIGGLVKNQEYVQYDIGIAAAHFCLQAAELQLGTCIIGWFNGKKIKKLLNVPKSKKIGLVITLGYPPDDYKQRKKIRKPVQEICGFNSYS
ncbi:Nitroreductase [Mariniphaga anaerophila]|uniref:Nitroreductase n=1 Tax=Mariniphaga anaerophila TaxID=1484053 RepID=A0A1M5CPP8_9BACT|nr:nitroreductase family protein [Mariniphaga anaerophila]SHF56666.1 Nitroreductase [Mariniphaga anaerophila]